MEVEYYPKPVWKIKYPITMFFKNHYLFIAQTSRFVSRYMTW